MRDIRVKAYSNEKGRIERLNKAFENLMERQNEFNQLQRVQLKKVEPYIPEDVRNNPRFGLMTEDELKQAIRESIKLKEAELFSSIELDKTGGKQWVNIRQHDVDELEKIFKTQYLGEWVEGD